MLAGGTTILLGIALALIFFYAPTDADQGFSQRIFYFHVPIALTSYVCFGWGAWKARNMSGRVHPSFPRSSARWMSVNLQLRR